MSLLPVEPEKGKTMRIYTIEAGGKVTLFMDPETDEEGKVFTDFARLDEPLVGAIKKDRIYKYPHMEIRKERN